MRLNEIRFNLRHFFVVLWMAALLPQTAIAANACHAVFHDSVIATEARSEGLKRYPQIRSDLAKTLAQIPTERRQNIEHLLTSVHFFDQVHLSKQLLDNFLNGRRQSFDFSRLYDRTETAGAPYAGFLRAKTWLAQNQPEVTSGLLLQIHQLVMKGQVEGVSSKDVGIWKNRTWVGNAKKDAALTKAEVEAIQQNPYLWFQESGTMVPSSPSSVWTQVSLWIKKRGVPELSHSPPRFEGYIIYPQVRKSSLKTINLIKHSHPELYSKLMLTRQRSTLDKAPPELEAEFTQALVEQRFARFHQERAALGKIEIGLNEKLYVNLVADLQRDLVSIHPMNNGNGRSTRLLMDYLLEKEGLPAARLANTSMDLQSSPRVWRDQVYEGVLNTVKLQADVLARVREGLTVEHSPELMHPFLPDFISISEKRVGSQNAREDAGSVPLDHSQFNAFIKTLTRTHPHLAAEIQYQQTKNMDRFAELFVEWARSKTVRYIHDKDGSRDLSLKLIDPDFTDLFGVLRAERKTLWEKKIDRWYDREMLVWRGLADKQVEKSDADLLNYFLTPSSHLASNQVVKSLSSRESPMNLMKKDFEVYNRELLDGKIVEMADDHHKTGPRYRDSYGYSTSKREVVGKAFAMGAMVIAEYGKQADPQLQAQLKSRINIAAYRAHKDVDLGRLRVFDPEFSYTYGRQAEVMGIGGTDADAVVLVQRIDLNGDVMHSFVRHPERPNEILKLSGRWVPGEEPLPEGRVLSRYQIQQAQMRLVEGDAPDAHMRPTDDAPAAPVAVVRPVSPLITAEKVQQRDERAEKGLFGRIRNWFGQ